MHGVRVVYKAVNDIVESKFYGLTSLSHGSVIGSGMKNI